MSDYQLIMEIIEELKSMLKYAEPAEIPTINEHVEEFQSMLKYAA